ncbi:MAG: patatin-like phospholipase family protein [Labilithrix sp.]|nr:patatin-like phospholipase family protein [Labilithrix sp.]MCW5810742.1 patatin-like phospholipase family protein [Labilithrix sp.]
MTQQATTRPSRRTAMILSGGGARGAYEVGVLWYIFDDLSRIRRSPPRVDILCGTSVGAINACYLAAHLTDPVLGMRRLVHLWSELQITRVLGFGVRQFAGIPRLLLGGGEAGTGLFDVTPMAELVQREISWRALARALRRKQLRALTVSTTEVSNGRTVVFMQTAPDVDIPKTSPPRTLFRADHIGPHHALASAAIPLLFPPVKIDDELYLDGGLRQNTPISPALRLGATHIFAIGSSREFKGVGAHEAGRDVKAPGAAFLLGKVLNAFLLDHVDVDLELLERMNNVLEDGTYQFGPGFTEAMSREAEKRNQPAYRKVVPFTLRPSEDMGKLASEHVRSGKLIGNPFLTRRLLNALDMGVGDEADLASYLLFDGHFCRQLIEMGRADAHARRDEILTFFEDAGDESGGMHEPDDSGIWDKPSLTLPIGT